VMLPRCVALPERLSCNSVSPPGSLVALISTPTVSALNGT
jgi:hypothetical protein